MLKSRSSCLAEDADIRHVSGAGYPDVSISSIFNCRELLFGGFNVPLRVFQDFLLWYGKEHE